VIADPRAFARAHRDGAFFDTIRRIGLPDRLLVAPAAEELLEELFLTGEPD